MSERTIQNKVTRLASCADDYELTECKRNICERTLSCNGKCSHCKIQAAYDRLFWILPERQYED